MKSVFENVIRSGNYKLTAMQRKIKQLWLEGDITEADKDELLALAANGVNPEGEKPSDDARFASLLERIEKLEAEVFKTEGGEDEVEAWKPWDGITDKYQLGAVVSHNGSIWESIFNGHNVWEPGAQGTENLWEKE